MEHNQIFHAVFAGCKENRLYIRIKPKKPDAEKYILKIQTEDDRYRQIEAEWKIDRENGRVLFGIPISELEREAGLQNSITFAVEKDGTIGLLKNKKLSPSRQYLCEIYDRSPLYGSAISCSQSAKVILPYYKMDGTLCVDSVSENDIYEKQFRNEIIFKSNCGDKIYLYTKCKKMPGSYFGIYPSGTDCEDLSAMICCDEMEEDEQNVYMRFSVEKKDLCEVYEIAWRYQNRIYHVPLVEAAKDPAEGRKYINNALSKRNIQNCKAFIHDGEQYTLDEFLTEDVGPTGKMYAKFIQNPDGTVWIEPFQKMGDVIEARLVMFHTQGLGIVSTQPVPVTNGIVEKFKLTAPDIEGSGKILKPVNSIWVRIALAVRTPKGIYLILLKNYDLDTAMEKGPIYDIRRLYCNVIGENTICGVRMLAVPYYGGNQLLGLKYVRPDQVYRSQFTNELLDVSIKKDILTVKMKCRDCGGRYKGVLLEYRKEKEEDAETYLIPYESLVKEDGFWIMTTLIDLKKYYLRMLYWDIRCAFEKDGSIYTVSCHSNNQKFLNKYRGVLVDRTYPNKNSILFPYATANRSVALMHRETCPQDHWNFRLKERVALKLYHAFQNYWDHKNIYLVFEKYCVMAQDNGYFFFKYCMESDVEKTFPGKLYYVIDPHAADWKKLKPYRSHVVKYLSLRHMIYLLAAHLLISTDTKGHAYVWRSMGSEIKAASYKKKLVFLQHGVTAFKRGHFERGTNVGCEYFITTSQFEHDIIHNYLGYPEDEVPITGFARWDVLHDKSEGHREILMMPTWRTWLDDAENEIFAESDYCKNYMALLNDPKLDELLKEYDITLNFYLHPKFRKFITEFSVVSDHIRLIPFGEEPLNELMMQCSLLITDFSSVAWDVYYMKKPVLFYHFDMEDANKTLGFYMDMKNDLFGERAETPDELMALIVEYIQNGFQMKDEYKQAHGNYFAYVDDHNSERIWKAIQEKFGRK